MVQSQIKSNVEVGRRWKIQPKYKRLSGVLGTGLLLGIAWMCWGAFRTGQEPIAFAQGRISMDISKPMNASVGVSSNPNTSHETSSTGPMPWVDSGVDVYFLTGRNKESSAAIMFRDVPSEYCTKPMQLQPEVIEAFGKMRKAAAGAGIALTLLSGRRTYEQQKIIWVNKWNKLQSRGIHGVEAVEQILRFSSMPGSSRHHWGTDIDINSLEPAYFTTLKGAKELSWLRANAGNYGFVEVYSPRSTGRKTGYQPEPWHWSYMPLASSYLTQYQQKIGYTHFGIPDSKSSDSVLVITNKKTTTDMVFPGSSYAKSVKIIENYVGGIYDKGTWKKPE